MSVSASPGFAFQGIPGQIPTLHSTKQQRYAVTLTTGVDNSVTLGKPGLYFITTSIAGGNGFLDFKIASTAAVQPCFAIPVPTGGSSSCLFNITENAAVLHGYQATGACLTVIICLMD